MGAHSPAALRYSSFQPAGIMTPASPVKRFCHRKSRDELTVTGSSHV